VSGEDNLRQYRIGALAVAVASAVIPYFDVRVEDDARLTLAIVVPLCLTWLGLVTFAVSRYRWRGLWLLVGAPLVFWWPFQYFMVVWGCGHGCP
jgi:hypothetical protein